MGMDYVSNVQGLTHNFRVEIQDRVHQLIKDPCEDDRREVERLQQLLTSQFNVLDALEHRAIQNLFVAEDANDVDDPAVFDNLDKENDDTEPSHALQSQEP